MNNLVLATKALGLMILAIGAAGLLRLGAQGLILAIGPFWTALIFVVLLFAIIFYVLKSDKKRFG